MKYTKASTVQLLNSTALQLKEQSQRMISLVS